MPEHIKNQRLQPFQPPPWDRSQSRPIPEGKLSNINKRPRRPNQGPKAFAPKKGNQAQRIKKILRVIEPLKLYYQLCNIEISLFDIFNKLNDIQYVNGIVNLSKHTLTKSETGVLSKGLGFCPTPGAPDIGNIIQDLDAFKRITRLNLFFQGSNEESEDRNTQSGVPFEHKSLKLKSTFNLVGPFQLETMFYSIEQDLHRFKYRQPIKKT